MMIKGDRYIVFLMKVHAQSGLSKVEEKLQCQILQRICKIQKADNERIVAQKADYQTEKKKNQ